MNKREKILAIITGGIICVIILYTLVNALLLGPAEELNNDMRGARKRIDELQTAKDRMDRNKARLKKLATQTFGRSDTEVGNATFGYLMAALDNSGLTSEGKGVTKGNTKNSSDLREVAWRVGKNGKMEHILNLLYMLESDPVLHRIENLSITPREKDGPFKVEFDYVALSLATRKGPQFSTTRPSDTKLAINMQSDRRKLYNVIPERDIFRRYIKRVDPPKPTPVARKVTPAAKPTPRPIPAGPQPKYRVCGLPTFKGQPEIWVVNEIDETGAVHKYKEGEKLMGWEIVMVDYRPMPDPDKPELLSPARVILRIDSNYWAIEGNQY
ncbi:MAG: hypothetical protein QGG25_07225, partial [Phycisphaerae bacterium]|nr:hypothetical protein [Phycisphaerae bacterium]